MRTQLSALIILCLPALHTDAQVRYSGEEYRDYYQWFHQYSQTPDFYQDGTTLVTFVDQAPLYTKPSNQSKLQAQLPLGKEVTNLVIPVENVTISQKNGYNDQWFKVEACTADRNVIQGYIWGGHLAKSWSYVQSAGQAEPYLLAIGLASETRQRPEDIKASMKIIKDGVQQDELILDGFCLFEDCGSSNLLRVFNFSGKEPLWVFEASTFTTGCLTGVDKALVSWDGRDMHLVHQAEYTTGHTYANNPFYVRSEVETQICYYKSENEQYDPVWACRTMDATAVIP